MNETHAGLWEFPMWDVQDEDGTVLTNMDPQVGRAGGQAGARGWLLRLAGWQALGAHCTQRCCLNLRLLCRVICSRRTSASLTATTTAGASVLSVLGAVSVCLEWGAGEGAGVSHTCPPPNPCFHAAFLQTTHPRRHLHSRRLAD